MRLVTTVEELQEGDHLVSDEIYKAVALLLMENSLFPHAAEHRVQSDVCPECSGKKKLFNAAGYPVPCHVCGGSGKRR